jgi:hypothetical protein
VYTLTARKGEVRVGAEVEVIRDGAEARRRGDDGSPTQGQIVYSPAYTPVEQTATLLLSVVGWRCCLVYLLTFQLYLRCYRVGFSSVDWW